MDANYVKLMNTLLKSDTYHGLATHDEHPARTFATQEKIARDSFEFQMLHGLSVMVATCQRWLAYARCTPLWHGNGYNFMRRLGERPAKNASFIARNIS